MESIKTVDIAGNIRYKNSEGYYHRIGGPSKIWVNGSTEWRINGEYHREDGPAVEWADGSKEWWINGEYHREDGPAVIYSNGKVEYWLNDKGYSKEEWEVEMFRIRIQRLKDL